MMSPVRYGCVQQSNQLQCGRAATNAASGLLGLRRPTLMMIGAVPSLGPLVGGTVRVGPASFRGENIINYVYNTK